ncbi:MAG TPA: multicopper oxidase domain-containing protein, partial [Thermoanaerobaculia bacterium]|nr:multicopper oxidase domain-containing protein [Thermoanaerobaculia bacterium]
MTSPGSRTDRRRFVGGGLVATAAWLGRRAIAAAQPPPDHTHHHSEPGAASSTVEVADAAVEHVAADAAGGVIETPDVPRLFWRSIDGAKEFHLVCDVVRQRFLPWREPFNVWGYNGSVPGPTVEVNEGDRVRFVVENRLPEPTSMHWHGLEVPQDMDGVPGLGQDL